LRQRLANIAVNCGANRSSCIVGSTQPRPLMDRLMLPSLRRVTATADNQFAIAEAHRRFDEAPEPGTIPAQGVVHRRR
jgi:hypothetical protein